MSNRLYPIGISTLEAYFQGKRELFQGLFMEKLEKEWVRYPILYLNLNIEKYDTVESLGNILNNVLTQWEKEYGSESSEVSFSLRFAGIIRRAHELTGNFSNKTRNIEKWIVK